MDGDNWIVLLLGVCVLTIIVILGVVSIEEEKTRQMEIKHIERCSNE